MAEKKFKFVSPGIFLEEIDNSQLPGVGLPPGPVIIGRTEKGPGMIPVTVNSFSEYVELFGEPMPGGRAGDVFREGNYSSPTYAGYAAQAWLKNQSPLTIIRLNGQHSSNRTSGDGDQNAGWDAGNVGTATEGAAGGAYGLFLMNSQSNGAQTWNLGAVFYAMNEGSLIALTGTIEQGFSDDYDAPNQTSASMAVSIATSSANKSAEFTALIGTKATIRGGTAEKVVFNFDENSDNYIRKVLNTNPIVTNSDIVSSTGTAYKNYFLGESFERSLLAEEYPGQQRGKLTSLNDVTHGVILGLSSQGASAIEWGDHQRPATKARSGWFIGQDLGNAASYKPADQQKLFRLIAREHGEWTQRNLKVSIQDIKPSSNKSDPFGSFTVAIRKMDDTDKAVRFIEKFTNCSLNPDSENYVARKIGDKYQIWDETERRYRHYGDYDNSSRSVYVEMNTEVAQGATAPELLPFGFFGAPKVKDVSSITNVTELDALGHASFIKGDGELPLDIDGLNCREPQFPPFSTSSYMFPILPLKHDGRQNRMDKQSSQYWGVDLGKSGSAKLDKSVFDVLRPLPGTLDSDDDTTSVEYSYVFSLDDIADRNDGGLIQYISGSRASHSNEKATATWTFNVKVDDATTITLTDVSTTSVVFEADSTDNGAAGTNTAVANTSTPAAFATALVNAINASSLNIAATNPASGQVSLTQGTAGSGGNTTITLSDQTNWDACCSVNVPSLFTGGTTAGSDNGSISSTSGSSALLTGSGLGYNKFTTVFHGGSDGLDITEKDPFRNTFMTAGTEVGNYAFYSIKRAIDTIKDPEVIEANLAVIPGITNSALTDHLIETCEDRADCMAIVDLEGDYVPPHENTATEATNRPNVTTTVNNLKSRQVNSSYAAAYYPFVQIRDTNANRLVYAPPSVVALGTLAYSEAVREVWFAPAGFTRGGLSAGAAGIPVTGVKLQLTSEERDDLYAANINPIASFPAEGVVVFGQKTLQVTPSALDRINVRRLLLLIKKQVSRIAATTLFEQNVQATWNKFAGQVETLLSNIKSGQGLVDYKVVLDETTTTPELVDRNILYAKIFLKPAQAIEFIALDFVITDSGASFAD